MAPLPATRRIALAGALLTAILLFFVALWVIFRGHIPHVSMRSSVHQRELELSLAPLSESLTRMEGGAREFVERMDPSRFLRTASAPTRPPPAPLKRAKNSRGRAVEQARPAPVPAAPPRFDGILPSGARGILVCDVNGNAVLASGATSRISAERDAKGFILDATGKSLVLAIPHQRGGQWLGSVYLYYDWANLLENTGYRGRFDPPGKKIFLTPAGMAVCALDDEEPENATLHRLDEHLKTYRTERGHYHLEDRGRSFQWATLSPFTLRVGVWFRDTRLGIPTVSLVLLLLLLLFIGALFYLNYLVLVKEEEKDPRGESPGHDDLPGREAERFAASMEARRASAAMERELLGSDPAPEPPVDIEEPVAGRGRLEARAEEALADLPDLSEEVLRLDQPAVTTAPQPLEEIPSGIFAPRKQGSSSPQPLSDEERSLTLPVIPEAVFDSPPAADPKLSNLIAAVDSDLPMRKTTPAPKARALEDGDEGSDTAPRVSVAKRAGASAKARPKRISPAKMTLVQLAEAIMKRKGIWSTKKQIAADLINRYPRLREARIAVLIDNGESHVTFQDHGISTATRGRLSIPHGNRLWTGFLSKGKIVHIGSHPEKSELLRRFFTPEDFKDITQVVFIPVASRQDGVFVTCVATGDDPTLPKKR